MRRSVRLRDSPTGAVAASPRLAGSSITARSSGALDRQGEDSVFGGRSSSSSNQSPIVMYQQQRQGQGMYKWVDFRGNFEFLFCARLWNVESDCSLC